MKHTGLKFIGVLFLISIITFSVMAFQTKPQATKPVVVKPKSIYDFSAKTIDGKLISLSKFKGKKILIVNVASKCGYTIQYNSLELLSKNYASKLVVIGFPANDFGQQEPGTNKEINEFCKANYGVTFQMMEKISVKGASMHPIYKWLSSKDQNGLCNEAPNWNFCKYLIDEKGTLINFFKSDIDPQAHEITDRI